MLSFGLNLASVITSGDVQTARIDYAASGPRAWSTSEAGAIRSACAKWGVDPTGFGVPRAPVCPPELWPVRALLVLPVIPAYPTSEDFQSAAMQADHADPIYAWRCEAVRWRMGHGGQSLDLPAIEAATHNLLALFARRAGAPLPLATA